ncbi:MAG: tagaturonate epimerase family protein [Armatimonadota bacterium]|nr:tagaturonate epimerase family protein [Armatimonadota bacterium]
MRINGIDIDPARNPAVLDTYTWDPPAAAALCAKLEPFLAECGMAVGTAQCAKCLKAALDGSPASVNSAALKDGTAYFILNLEDGQKVVAVVSPKGVTTPVAPLATFVGGKAAVMVLDTQTAKWYVTDITPQFSPRALGNVPRLGIGARQTVTVWPGIIEGLKLIGGSAETIQNSAFRELAPKSVVLAPPIAEMAYLPGHGAVNIGHTGSSIEGFWLAGVVCHIENNCTEPYGADLDHIPIKSLDEQGIAHAKYLVECGKHFTFFTVDVSALFNFATDDLSRRYDAAVEAAVELYDYIRSIKNGEAFDFEFSLDEGPALTEPAELKYVLDRLSRKGVSTTFVAPNVGFEKRVDYRKPDGLEGLEKRVRELSRIAADYGALLDFHSGSDKSSETYRTISRACDGKLKLKVSGKLQLILAEVLADMDPKFFREWWNYTLSSAKVEAESGNPVAAEYLSLLEERRKKEGDAFRPLPTDRFFTDFSFGMVGAKDDHGKFLFREKFYSLSPEVQAEYTKRVSDYIVGLAEDLDLKRR